MRLDPMHSLFVFLSAASVVVSLGSALATTLRRWPLGRRLAFVAMGSGLAVPALGCLSLLRLAAIGPYAIDAASKATFLAGTIAETLNCSVLALPGIVLGVLALAFVTARGPGPEANAG